MLFPTLLCFALAPLVLAAEPKPTWYSECESLGFQAGQLPCGTCSLLAKALGSSSEVVQQCKSCCSPQLDVGTVSSRKKFDTVTVRVCRAQPGGGGVNEWLEKKESSWAEKGVVVEDACTMYGEPASIVLSNDGDVVVVEEEADTKQKKKKGGVPGKGSAKGAFFSSSSSAASSTPTNGVAVPISAWKLEHIDAFIAASLKKE